MSSYLNTEPDLDDHESILESYPAECYLVVNEDPDVGPNFRFHAPARKPITFEDEDRARLFAELYIVTDGFRIKEGVGERGIPVNIATSKSPAIAAYMYAAWGSTPSEIARRINADRETVLSYIGEIRTKADKIVEGTEEPDTVPGELG